MSLKISQIREGDRFWFKNRFGKFATGEVIKVIESESALQALDLVDGGFVMVEFSNSYWEEKEARKNILSRRKKKK